MDEDIGPHAPGCTEEPLPGKPGYKIVRLNTRKGPMAWIVSIQKDHKGYQDPPEPNEHPLQMFDRIYDAAMDHIKMSVYNTWNDMQKDTFEGKTECFRFRYNDRIFHALVSNENESCNAQLNIRIIGVDFDSLCQLKSSLPSTLLAKKPGYVLLDEIYDSAFPSARSLIDACTNSKPTYFFNKDKKRLELKAWTAETPDSPAIGLSIVFAAFKPDPDCFRRRGDDEKTVAEDNEKIVPE